MTYVAKVMVEASEFDYAMEAIERIEDEMKRTDALAAVARAMAKAVRTGDPQGAHWLIQTFWTARRRGREEVLRHIGAFAPVMGRLGVIVRVWERMKAVEGVVG